MGTSNTQKGTPPRGGEFTRHGNIDPERRYPSMFEPIHGSAFDIMDKGLAKPVGTFWSCVMLLEQ